MKLFVFILTMFPNTIIASTGGNCENVCNYQIDNYWTPCVEENCPQIHGLCPTRNATTCVCSKNCQMCVDDLYNECGGCSNKYGYNFDKNVGPKYKNISENMGCNSGNIIKPMISLSFLSILIITTYLV